MVTMLPKEAGATTLTKYRPISLMTQLQKLYTRWILSQCGQDIDKHIAETQSGFRRHRQAAETLYTIQRTIETHLEWAQPLTIIKVDLQKAFDTIYQSSILKGLIQTNIHPTLIFNPCRELIGNRITPHIWGCQPEHDIPLKRGSKQGAPESGLLFILAIQYLLHPLVEEWNTHNRGFKIDDITLSHLIFVDDLIIIANTPEEAAHMLKQAEAALGKGGLHINKDKTSYITDLPQRAATCLPGKNLNKTGIPVLGRHFILGDNTDQEIQRREAVAWSKFHKIKHILRAPTSIHHRIHIFNACVIQSLLWASQTWHVTKSRLQHLRGIERRMLRTFIPLPKHFWDLSPEHRHQIHNRLINTTLTEIKHEKLDAKFLRKWTSWAGHLARLPEQRLARKLAQHKNVSWWRKEQQKPQGHRHTKTRGSISRLENTLVRYHPAHHQWIKAAQNRTEWPKQCEIYSRRARGLPEPAQANHPNPSDPHNPNTTRERNKTPPSRKRPPQNIVCPPAKLSRKKPEHKDPSWEELLQTPLIQLAPQAATHGRRLRNRCRGHPDAGLSVRPRARSSTTAGARVAISQHEPRRVVAIKTRDGAGEQAGAAGPVCDSQDAHAARKVEGMDEQSSRTPKGGRRGTSSSSPSSSTTSSSATTSGTSSSTSAPSASHASRGRQRQDAEQRRHPGAKATATASTAATASASTLPQSSWRRPSASHAGGTAQAAAAATAAANYSDKAYASIRSTYRSSSQGGDEPSASSSTSAQAAHVLQAGTQACIQAAAAATTTAAQTGAHGLAKGVREAQPHSHHSRMHSAARSEQFDGANAPSSPSSSSIPASSTRKRSKASPGGRTAAAASQSAAPTAATTAATQRSRPSTNSRDCQAGPQGTQRALAQHQHPPSRVLQRHRALS